MVDPKYFENTFWMDLMESMGYGLWQHQAWIGSNMYKIVASLSGAESDD